MKRIPSQPGAVHLTPLKGFPHQKDMVAISSYRSTARAKQIQWHYRRMMLVSDKPKKHPLGKRDDQPQDLLDG
jgi:hypothetical protein